MGRRESRVRNISLILCRIGMGNFTMSRVISTLRKFARDQSQSNSQSCKFWKVQPLFT